MTRLAILTALMASLTTTAVQAADAPAEIKLGTLYASSGRFASISMPVHYGLKLWIDQKNADGGVYVKEFNKKIPLKLTAYDDQSNTATAATLYNQLITQDKVDILIADSGSVLTSVAVPIARDHKMFLIDQTGTGANFFTPDNPYIALMADPVSSDLAETTGGFSHPRRSRAGHQARRYALCHQRLHRDAGQCGAQVHQRIELRGGARI